VELVETLPASWYSQSHIYERERATVFHSAWIHVGFDSELVAAGDYLTEDVAGFPIFVRRLADGSLSAFHNVCPHRAGPLVWEGCGHSANLTCRYHGWAFTATGNLLSARDFGADVPDGIALTTVQVASWRGFVFVCLDPATPPLVEWLGGFPGALADVPLEDYRFVRRTVRRVACNWKTYADNFLEGYHVPTVHPSMSRDADALQYVVHQGDDPRWNIHTMPPRGETYFGVFGWFWPCFAFNVVPGGFAVERWLPRGPHEIDLIFDYLFADNAVDTEEIFVATEEVADEDARVSAFVQRNLESGAYDTGLLSPKWELPLAAFHQMVRDAVSATS
jgi:choline monooxygenase